MARTAAPVRVPRRALLLVAAAAFVALTASACLPATDAATAPPSTTTTTVALASSATPPSLVQCPVVGFTLNQGFGPTHGGVDLAAPLGTPVIAVRNGTLWYWSTGDVGGYSVYLKADDGNTYYYTHLKAYAPTLENTTTVVRAGDVIEWVDHTGNANGFDHLHFEVRIGGPNGTRVDPLPTLTAARCR
jgi:murein DD-endopeptidase MepM/ murein hydrolase activator NlpD